MKTAHHIVIGLGGNGFRASCSCGWHSDTDWSRAIVAWAGGEHKRRTRLRSIE